MIRFVVSIMAFVIMHAVRHVGTLYDFAYAGADLLVHAFDARYLASYSNSNLGLATFSGASTTEVHIP